MCTLAYLITLIVSITSIAVSYLLIDALTGFIVLGILVNQLRVHGETKVACKMWGIHAGYYIAVILVLYGIATLLI